MKVAIINDTRPTNHYGCRLVMENTIRLLAELGVEVVWTWPVSVDWRKHRRKLLSMPSVDAIIINGEGTIHHNTERKFSQALIDFADFSETHLRKPCYLINATLHANSKDAYNELSRFRAIFVRDRASLKELDNSGNCSGYYVPDMTFASNPAHRDSYSPSKPLIVIDSAVKKDSEKLRNFASENGGDFRSMVVARVSNARFIRSPRPWIKNVIRFLVSDRNISVDPNSYIADLRKYELVVTGRYHTVTMCIKNRIPFISLESNTPKVNSLLNDVFGNAQRSIGIEALGTEVLQDFSTFEDEELRAISNFTSSAENSIRNMIASIKRDIENGTQGAFRF